MNYNTNLQIEKDLTLKNNLVKSGIICTKRVILCGQWFNKNFITKSKGKITHTRYFCKKWECRMCRRRIIENNKNKHYLLNKKFIKDGGQIIILSLTIPNFLYTKDNETYKKYKNSISLLKESRGWKKIKSLTDCQYHYDDIEIVANKNSFKIYNYIILGFLNKNILKNEIYNILYKYWSISTKKMGLGIISSKFVNIVSTIFNKRNLNIEVLNSSLSCVDKDISKRSKINGTLEYFEEESMMIYNQPMTNLKAFEYIKRNTLNQHGTIIKNINSMYRNTRHGRIWYN